MKILVIGGTRFFGIHTVKELIKEGHKFNTLNHKLIWCSREDFSYDEVKRQAECALWQVYPHTNAIAVRYPFVLGNDDYTNRLQFYVEHTLKEIPIHIDNLDHQMSFIHSSEAGKFMAFLATSNFTGPINGASNGTISIREILEYIKFKTGKETIITPNGDVAPYNNEVEYSINTNKAQNLGFEFSNLKDWIFDLLDYYINQIIA